MFKQKVKDKELWQRVRESEDYAWLRGEVLKQYNQFAADEDIPSLKYSDYKLYYSTGNRMIYEKKYFARRQRLNALAILSMIYPDNEEYISSLHDIIGVICDEYTWVLPAHCKHFPSTEYDTIDLFSAETGFALSEIKYILQERLDTFILNRIDDEIDRKIINPFLSASQTWEQWENNWAAVCAGSVGAAFMYQRPELFDSIEGRLDGALQEFLLSYYDDGACREGLNYWEYGFGFFTYYAELVKDFTNGKIDYFKGNKIKTIAAFPQKAFLTESVTLSYADGNDRSRLSVGLIHLLKDLCPDTIIPLPQSCLRYDEHCARWCHQIRSFVFYNHQYTKAAFDNNSTYYMSDSAWYVKKCPSYSFSVKAGNNDEPHNHNDIGSFIIAKNDVQLICDLGAGEYTRDYFSDKRYDILCNSSLGHCVPIINGMPQRVGKQHNGVMTVNDGYVSVDMKKAYDAQNLAELERKFSFSEHRISMTDKFSFISGGEYVCRLVSLTKPELCSGVIKIGELSVSYDDEKWSPTVVPAVHTTHENPTDIPVYLIDFKSDGDVCCISLDFTF